MVRSSAEDLLLYVCVVLDILFMSYGFPGHAGGKESSCNAGDLIQSMDPEDPLEKEMTTHSSNLAWRIPRTKEPCVLQSTGLQRVGHD